MVPAPVQASAAARPVRTAQVGGAGLLVLLLAVAQVVAAALPAMGVGTPVGDRSDRVHTLITPAGWAFSIWGALYVGGLAFALYQALPAQRGNRLIAALRWPAAAAFLGNTLWAAYVQVGAIDLLSVAIIGMGLAGGLAALRRIADWPERFSSGERWCAVLPLTALSAWLTAATIVNVAAALRHHGVEAGAATAALVAGCVVLAGGAVAALALRASKGCPPFALVFLWALAAIAAAGGRQSDLVAIAAGLAALLVAGGAWMGLRGGGARHWFR